MAQGPRRPSRPRYHPTSLGLDYKDMLDKDKGGRLDAALPYGQDLLVRMRAAQPAVPVVVKRRRALAPAAAQAEPGDPAATPDKAPRVFRLQGHAAAAVPTAPAAQAAEPGAPLRRRRRDPSRRPGEVRHIVVEHTPDDPGVTPPQAGTPDPSAWLAVQAALQRVRAELERARAARRFRIG